MAAAGVEEFVLEFLPGLLTQVGFDTLSGTLHLHGTDGPTEWWIDLNHDGLARREHARPDTALRGTRSDLLLWLTNRQPPKLSPCSGSAESSSIGVNSDAERGTGGWFLNRGAYHPRLAPHYPPHYLSDTGSRYT